MKRLLLPYLQIVSLFDLSSSQIHLGGKKFDLITAFNVFAHSQNMESMIKAVKYHLKKDGIFCFEVQSLKQISRKKILGTFFHEHMIHYSLIAAKAFLEIYDLKIIDFQENNIQHGSTIFICTHKESNMFNQSDKKILEAINEERKIGLDSDIWAKNLKEYIIESKSRIKNIFSKLEKLEIRKIPAYGAARSGPTFAIQFGLDNKISKIFDDHTSKVGLYSPFNNLFVDKTENLNAIENKFVVILAYIHFKQIINKHIKYISDGGSFIILWPEVLIINKSNFSAILERY